MLRSGDVVDACHGEEQLEQRCLLGERGPELVVLEHAGELWALHFRFFFFSVLRLEHLLREISMRLALVLDGLLTYRSLANAKCHLLILHLLSLLFLLFILLFLLSNGLFARVWSSRGRTCLFLGRLI